MARTESSAAGRVFTIAAPAITHHSGRTAGPTHHASLWPAHQRTTDLQVRRNSALVVKDLEELEAPAIIALAGTAGPTSASSFKCHAWASLGSETRQEFRKWPVAETLDEFRYNSIRTTTSDNELGHDCRLPTHDSLAGHLTIAGPTNFGTDTLIDLGFGVLHQLELRYSSVMQFILTLQLVNY